MGALINSNDFGRFWNYLEDSALINSNDFGRFWNYLEDSNLNCGVVEIISKNNSNFLFVRGWITYNVDIWKRECVCV